MHKLCIDYKNYSFYYFRGFSCLLCETLNKSDKLFYPLILYDMPYLCKLSNRPGEFFYPLILSWLIYLLCKLLNRPDRIFYLLTFSRHAHYTKHWIGQMDSSILWDLTALLFVISLSWVVTLDIECIPPWFWPTFDLHTFLIWFTGFITTLVLKQLRGKVP